MCDLNTKYISSSVLKTSEFSQVRSSSENFDVFKTHDTTRARAWTFSH